MKKNTLAILNSLISLLLIFTLFSCGDAMDNIDNEPESVDLEIEIGGKKSEMTSAGFFYFDESNGKRELRISFLSEASFTAINTLTISIPDFKEGKSKYSAENGEVKVTYEGDVDVSAENSLEWISKKGTVEITTFSNNIVEGKIEATLYTPSLKGKILELKNGKFKIVK